MKEIKLGDRAICHVYNYMLQIQQLCLVTWIVDVFKLDNSTAAANFGAYMSPFMLSYVAGEHYETSKIAA